LVLRLDAHPEDRRLPTYRSFNFCAARGIVFNAANDAMLPLKKLKKPRPGNQLGRSLVDASVSFSETLLHESSCVAAVDSAGTASP
jgi:hypothetical protein